MASSTNMVRSVVRLSILSLILVWTQGLQHETTYLQDLVHQYACIHNISHATGEVHSHRGAEETTYQNSLDCTVTINAEPGKRINIRFDFFDLSSMYDTILKQCRGNGDRVYIYDKGDILLIRNDKEIPQVTLCGGTGTFPSDHQSTGNVVTLRFISDGATTEDKGFKFIYTQFTTPSDDATDCFQCEDGTMCIDQDLVCNDLNNCNDNSDEKNADCNDAPQDIFALGVGVLGIGVVAIVGATVGVVFLIILIVCIVCCCRLRKSNNHGNHPPSARPASYPNHSPVPRYATHPPPPPPPPPSTSPFPPHAYQMYNGHGGQHHHHHPGPGVMYHHSHESVDLPPKI